MSELVHLIYASAAAHAQTDAELAAILTQARENNQRDNVTGMLLHSEGSFFQILEGDASVIETVFARIDRDARHQQTTCIIREPMAERAFEEWTMGFATLSHDQVDEIVGLNDFFVGGHCLNKLDAGRARKLLQAFAAGRWRTRLNRPTVAFSDASSPANG